MVDNILLSFKGIFSHKMRSFLTMLGIIIGISSIISIVSTIRGTDEQIRKNLIGSGVNNINVRLTQGGEIYQFHNGLPAGIKVLTIQEKKELQTIDKVESVSFYRLRQDYDAVKYLTNSIMGGFVMGVDEHYFDTAGLVITKGKGFSASDIKNNNHVVILDDSAAEQLFESEEPVGKTIEIKGQPFVVIGIVKPKIVFEPNIKTIQDYYLYRKDVSGKVYVLENIWPLIYQYDEPQHVLIKTNETSAMTQIGHDAEKILNNGIDKESGINYKAEDLLKKAQQLQELSNSTNLMLLWIAGISLLVGGIGVMNIMLVSVTERTTEIGLKKALGANRKIILGQFLTEAVVLTSLGGILGVLFGIVLSWIISGVTNMPMVVSLDAGLLAVLFSMFIGIVFGILPSYKAANLDPIEALRRE